MHMSHGAHEEENLKKPLAPVEGAEYGHTPGHTSGPSERPDHNAMMIADFRRRFWWSLAVTVPILIFSPVIQDLFGLGGILRFDGDGYVLLALSSVVYFYGGYPFLRGFFEELRTRSPGMMTLVAVAISTAYVYSERGRFWPRR